MAVAQLKPFNKIKWWNRKQIAALNTDHSVATDVKAHEASLTSIARRKEGTSTALSRKPDS